MVYLIIIFILIILFTISILCYVLNFYLPKMSTQNYNFFTEYEDYRIGDIYYERLGPKKYMIEEKINNLYPNSLAALYIKNKKHVSDYSTFIKLIDDKYNNNNNKNLNKPSVNNNIAVIHLRLGDILDDPYYENNKKKINQKLYNNIPNDNIEFPDMILIEINGKIIKRVENSNYYLKSINFYKKIIKKLKDYNVKNIIIMSGSHIKCNNFNLSTYVFNIIKKLFQSNGFIVESQIGNSPDFDIYQILNNKYFIPGKGGYSSLLKDLAHKKGIIILK